MNNLVTALKSGDENAFKELVDTYRQKVFNTAISFLQHNEWAEDISQEVFIEVYQSIHKFNEQARLSTWIYRVTVNKCLDSIRAQKRQKRFGFITGLFNGETGQPVYEKVNFDHPGIKMEQKENARFLFEAIDTLPDNQKTAFLLSQVEDCPQKEVAEIMELSVKAVESLIQRAKANLRKKLENIYHDRRK